ncbi:hypothetical protein RE9431_49780 (plasmid) [Prescottella equi]|nr:hypothetical protein RE9431_49780 [Prescottella equi]
MDLGWCVDTALKILPQMARENFTLSPIQTLRTELGIEVECVEHLAENRNDGGACDGISFLQDGVILYAPTPHSRRENFTLGHELGHWLVEQAEELYDWIADQDDPPRLLETVCDHIAQRLLLPDGVVDTVIGKGPIRAHHVLELFDVSHASRPVCAIALAKRLPSLGAVLVVDQTTARVSHSSVRPDLDRGWPTVFPWRNQLVPDGHPLLNLAPGGSVTKRVIWRNRWDAPAEFYVDAVHDGGKRVMAVFSDIDLWNAERLHVDPPREFDERPATEIYCCGKSQIARGYPCPTCEQPFCPQCKHCRCERAALREQTCNGCYLRFQPHLLMAGLCEECRG